MRRLDLDQHRRHARGVVAHAIDDDAFRFYRGRGFLFSPLGERMAAMPIETVRVLFAGD